MMHVVADTTVYRADPRREKAAFRALSRLACAGHLMLHIPEIVRREFISQERDQYSTNVQALLTEFHHLAKRSLPGAVAEFVAGSIRELASLSADLGNFSEAEFAKWAEQMSAIIHPIVESHGARVVEAYFAGTPPFRDPKRRDDFPDAFLWQAVLDLAASHTPLFVISSDKGILKAARGTHDVIPFASLEEFVASEPFQAVLKAHFASTTFKALVTLLPQHLDLISSAIANELVDKLAGQAVRSDEIPDDNSEAMISIFDNHHRWRQYLGGTSHPQVKDVLRVSQTSVIVQVGVPLTRRTTEQHIHLADLPSYLLLHLRCGSAEVSVEERRHVGGSYDSVLNIVRVDVDGGLVNIHRQADLKTTSNPATGLFEPNTHGSAPREEVDGTYHGPLARVRPTLALQESLIRSATWTGRARTDAVSMVIWLSRSRQSHRPINPRHQYMS